MFIWILKDVIGLSILGLVILIIIVLVVANGVVNFIDKIKSKFKKGK